MGNRFDKTRPLNWIRTLVVITCTIGLAGCVHYSLHGEGTPDVAEIIFEQYEAVTGFAKSQTVLPGFFLGNATAELAVLNIGENNDRRLRIYAFGDGTWPLMLDAPMRPEVMFVDVANIGGCDRLITYERGRLNWFDPESAVERALVETATNYKAAHEDRIPHVDITRDVNRDGRDDLVVSDTDGFWISTQLSNGTFTTPLKLGPPEPYLDEIAFDNSRSYGKVGITAMTIPWYQSRVHEMDYDRDGRSDLVFWNEDHFDVYHQDTRGLFSPVSETFTTDVPFDSDGDYSLMFGFSGESTFSLLSGFRKKTKRTVLHSFRDMNGDRVADLVTQSLEGRSLLRQRRRYEVHFGAPTPDGTLFARDVSMAIQPHGKAGGLQHSGYSSQWFQDFDGDGQVDITFRDVIVGGGGMMRALVGNSIALDLEFYRNEGGVYPGKPTTTRKIRPNLNPFRRRGPFFPAVLLGDVNGDGHADLLVGKNWNELNVFIGVSGPDLFERNPQKVTAALPDNEENIWLVDFNKDGKQDILMHHPSTTEPHQLMMLIAQ